MDEQLVIGSPEWHAAWRAHLEQDEREQVARLGSPALSAQLEAVKAAEKALEQAKQALKDGRERHAELLAEVLGVRIGTRVRRIRERFEKTIIRDFEVTRIDYGGVTSLSLRGKSIRKDGSLGELVDIGTDWEIIKEGEAE